MYEIGEVIMMSDKHRDLGIIIGKSKLTKCYTVDFSNMNNAHRTKERVEVHQSWFEEIKDGEEI